MHREFPLVLAVCALAAGCVPEGPATGDHAPPPKPVVTLKPPVTPSSAPSALAPSGPLITAPFEDDFDRVDLGPDYNTLSPKWKINGGRLCAKGAHNKGVWLLRRLPPSARIEFDAIAESAEGDLKAELWGDGASGAKGQSYNDATSYILILGGWKNTKHVLARLDEHGEDRQAIDVDPNSDDERARSVAAGQPYHFKIDRADGKTLVWSINNVVYFELADPDPLTGPGHEHLGFNDWDAGVCFDNLKITPL